MKKLMSWLAASAAWFSPFDPARADDGKPTFEKSGTAGNV
jgi:hypothetical protein